MAKVSLLDILGQPAWQGAGAIIAVSALVVYIWIEGRRRKRKSLAPRDDQCDIEYFLLTDDASKQRYYEKLAACIRNAEDEIYRTGRGFDQDRKSGVYSALIAAEQAALAPGHLQMIRIQLDGASVRPGRKDTPICSSGIRTTSEWSPTWTTSDTSTLL